MSVCTSVNVSQRFLIQRESNKSQLLYMQVYLYISIMMASIQTEAWQAQVGRCTDVNWDQRDVTLTSAAGIHHIYSAPFHNLPHTPTTTRRHLLHSNMPHSSSSLNNQWRPCLPRHGCQEQSDHHNLEPWQGATSIYVYRPIFAILCRLFAAEAPVSISSNTQAKQRSLQTIH